MKYLIQREIEGMIETSKGKRYPVHRLQVEDEDGVRYADIIMHRKGDVGVGDWIEGEIINQGAYAVLRSF